jgi:hypothetical protein
MTSTGGGGRENSGMDNNNENSSYDNFKDNAKNKINAVVGDFSSCMKKMA